MIVLIPEIEREREKMCVPGSLFKIKREEFLGYGVVEVKKRGQTGKRLVKVVHDESGV